MTRGLRIAVAMRDAAGILAVALVGWALPWLVAGLAGVSP